MLAALQSENRLTRCLTSALLAAAIASPLPARAQ
jgi:hypothetical protein